MLRAVDGRQVPGSCLCGAVRFEIDLPVLFCAHCHCSMCRRAHGAGYVTWIGVPYDRFRIREGTDTLVRYRSSDHGTRSFCGSCGSSRPTPSALAARGTETVGGQVLRISRRVARALPAPWCRTSKVVCIRSPSSALRTP